MANHLGKRGADYARWSAQKRRSFRRWRAYYENVLRLERLGAVTILYRNHL